MKITTFTGTAKENITVMKPIQYLLIEGKASVSLDKVLLRVQLNNSANGSSKDIITQVDLQTLGEIATMNDGHFVYDAVAKTFKVHVMLNPVGSVRLDNDKYLQIEISGLDGASATSIYGIEDDEIAGEFVVRYQKLFMAAGEETKQFAAGTNEHLIFPIDAIDELQLNCKTGTNPVYTPSELKAKMRMHNDVVCTKTEGKNTEIVTGSLNLCQIDLANVENFEMRRASNKATGAVEVILLDAAE